MTRNIKAYLDFELSFMNKQPESLISQPHNSKLAPRNNLITHHL